MQKVALSKELGATTYPGRGIVIGRSKDGKKAVTAYFIMGRSANSRNRIVARNIRLLWIVWIISYLDFCPLLWDMM